MLHAYVKEIGGGLLEAVEFVALLGKFLTSLDYLLGRTPAFANKLVSLD